MNSSGVPDVACVRSAIPAAERQTHFALARELFETRAKERVVLPGGYAIRFAADAFEAVARFVANERNCCPFMSFEIRLDSALGPLWLHMTGPEGTRGVLDAELNLTTSEYTRRQCGCDKTSGSDRLIKWTAAGGLLAALGVCAACCLLPFALLSVGVAGTWVATLDRFAEYKWAFIGLRVATLLAISGIVFERFEPMLTISH